MRVNLELVHQCIRDRGWGQNQFARKAGLSPGFVSRVFNGKRNDNSMAFLDGCRRAFPEVDVMDFLVLEEEEEDTPPRDQEAQSSLSPPQGSGLQNK